MILVTGYSRIAFLLSSVNTKIRCESSHPSGFQREAERDARKAIAKEKKEQGERDRLLAAITVRFLFLKGKFACLLSYNDNE